MYYKFSRDFQSIKKKWSAIKAMKSKQLEYEGASLKKYGNNQNMTHFQPKKKLCDSQMVASETYFVSKGNGFFPWQARSLP